MEDATRYATIVADPPWPYDNANKAAMFANRKLNGELSRSVNNWSYEPMSMDSLKSMDIGEQAADNAHLYLWTTNSFMVEAHELARAWGFKPKTILTWVKTHADDRSRVSMKMGYYFRGATEHVVFAVRGSLRLEAMVEEGFPTAYLWPRRFRHSEKPDEFYDLVEKVSPSPRLDVFARRDRQNWDTYGDQVEKLGILRMEF